MTDLVEVNEPRGKFHGVFVEIQGVPEDAAIEALDNVLRPLGVAVDPNGKQGWASWDDEQEIYNVYTIDGLVLQLAEQNLVACEREKPEDTGGRDLSWPTISLTRGVGATFAYRVAEVLQEKGYCLIEMPEAANMRQGLTKAAKEREDFELPRPSFEESFLGKQCVTRSKVAWLGYEDTSGSDSEPLAFYSKYFMNLHSMLFPICGEALGFEPCSQRSGAMLRMPLAEGEDQALPQRPDPSADDVENGVIEAHLDFLQRRAVCMMYFVDGEGGEVEFRSRRDPSRSIGTVRIAGPNKLLLFRHALLGYTYSPVAANDLVLQGWMMEAPQQIELDELDGGFGGLATIMGAPTLAPDKQVHIMVGHCRFPANAYGLERDWCAYNAQTDTFIEIPMGRFDIQLYYTDDADQFNASGKSSTKHCGLISDDELRNFDNEFFGMSQVQGLLLPCIQRVILEVGYECMVMGGFTKKTMKTESQYHLTCIADIGLEWDGFFGKDFAPEEWLTGNHAHNVLTHNRLCHVLDLRGPAIQVDTACSASLVACCTTHAYLRQSQEKHVYSGMAMGLQHILQPWPFIGLSGAGMLGRGGRSKTFDQSANGYNRGEGCGGLFARANNDMQLNIDRLAAYIGSYVNQDGRSASLTAPNGPSQQMVVRGSLEQAQVSIGDPQGQENHGTGTALGDPIETGTVRSVFRRRPDTALFTGSGKTHMGHLEAGAGAIGILKTVCAMIHGAFPANCHLRQLNAHCDFDGFPGAFPVESACVESDYHYMGANGFGFGGTNSRSDFWTRRRNETHTLKDMPGKIRGRNLVVDMLGDWTDLPPKLDQLDFLTVRCAKCLGPMHYLDGQAVPESSTTSRHRCSTIRDDNDNYRYCSNCYTGEYRLSGVEELIRSGGNGIEPGEKVYIAGSFDNWTGLIEMQYQAHPEKASLTDVFVGEVVLSDILFDTFHIVVKKGKYRKKQIIHPIARKAGQQVRISGPNSEHDAAGKHWLLDGRRDNAAEGSVYRIVLEWGDFKRAIMWEPTGEVRKPAVYHGSGHHVYCMASSLAHFEPWPGTRDYDGDPVVTNYFKGKIPAGGRVEFVLMRDSDKSQMIYPLHGSPTDSSVPICGPDEGGDGKRWSVTGKPGETIYGSLRVEEGNMSFSVKTASMGELKFTGTTARTYHLSGSFNKEVPTELERVPGSYDMWRGQFIIGFLGRERFQIIVNNNFNLRLYPERDADTPGESIVCGPDRRGVKKYWEVQGAPGQLMEIALDLGAEDFCEMLSCWPVTSDAIDEGA